MTPNEGFAIALVLERCECMPRTAMPLAVYIANVADARSRKVCFNHDDARRYFCGKGIVVSLKTVCLWWAELGACGWILEASAHGRNGVCGTLGPVYRTDYKTDKGTDGEADSKPRPARARRGRWQEQI